MKFNQGEIRYLLDLPIANNDYAEKIRNEDLAWYHTIKIKDYVTPGRDNRYLWNALADFLNKSNEVIARNAVLEFGPADGLWSCWLTHCGAKEIVSADFRNYRTYQLIIGAFQLPVTYHPNLISTATPRVVKGRFPCVVSLGVLYHVHDVLTTLAMYSEYLETGGSLLLESAVVEDSTATLYYSPDGFILPAKANNNFAPTIGFLSHALKHLGMEILDEQFLPVRVHETLNKRIGRYILHAKKTARPDLTLYNQLIKSLGF